MVKMDSIQQIISADLCDVDKIPKPPFQSN